MDTYTKIMMLVEYEQNTIIYKHTGITKHINMIKQDFSTATNLHKQRLLLL